MNKKEISTFAKNQITDLFTASEDRSTSALKDIIKRYLEAFPQQYSFIDYDEMYTLVRLEVNVDAEQKNSKLIKRGYEPWLYDDSDNPRDSEREPLEWDYWKDLYKKHKKTIGHKRADKTFEDTREVLSLIQDPLLDGEWYIKGMVVGHVQSGKTNNYTGLITRAADAGYKIFIILAGAHKDLRKQAQSRLDEDFYGIDTSIEGGKIIGVGKYNENRSRVETLTNSSINGDFKLTNRDAVSYNRLPNEPIYFVVKKHVSILKNLNSWLSNFVINEKLIENPLLFIDDECDYASVNTSYNPTYNDRDDEDDYNPTKINMWIRTILSQFQRKSYVGYTATPYANIFIDRFAENDEYGADLFPDHFIYHLKPPKGIYMGPEEYFGRKYDIYEEDYQELPFIKQISPYDLAYLKTEQLDQLPESLIEAVKTYILAAAIRYTRGQSFEHNTMLVHIDRLTMYQSSIKKEVARLVKNIENDIKYQNASLLKDLFITEFSNKTEKIKNNDNFDESITLNCRIHQWQDVQPNLIKVLDKLSVREVNSTSDGEPLDYDQFPDGVNFIAVGGDKLSRGLTLEGLTVSYYLRGSKYYDTLMQMGRWFGYRAGYLDLCRVFTTKIIIDRYREISQANIELLDDFDSMAKGRYQPLDFGMKVRNDSKSLWVTNTSKSRTGEYVDFRNDYAKKSPYTTKIFLDQKTCKANHATLELFLKEKPYKFDDPHYVFSSVPSEDVMKFLKSYSLMPDQRDFNPQLMCDYIKDMNENHSKLDEWNCVLISKKQQIEETRSNLVCINNDSIHLASRDLTAEHMEEKMDWVHFPRGFSDPAHRKKFKNKTKPTLLLYHLFGNDPIEGGPFGKEEYVPLGIMILFPDPKVKIETKRVLADQLLRDEQIELFENAGKHYWADDAF